MEQQQLQFRQIEEEDLPSIAVLHARVFRDYFTTWLGPEFLWRLYREFVGHPKANGFVAVRDREVVGFVVGVTDATAFYTHFYRRNFGALVAIVLHAVVSCRAVRRGLRDRTEHLFYALRIKFQNIFGTTTYDNRSLVQARLLSIGLAPELRGRGIADQLVENFCAWLRGCGIQWLGLSVRADNCQAIDFYRRTGWQREMEIGDSVYFFRSTSNRPATLHDRELDRIRIEYARRAADSELAGRYSRLNLANLFAIHSRERALAVLLRSEGLTSFANVKVLDVGCGSGSELMQWLFYGASPKNLMGIDLLHDRVHTAHVRAPHLFFAQADAQHLPCANALFDVVVQATVFSSILDPEFRRHIAFEMMRVLKPGGLIIWYDFIVNPLNPHTRGIGRGEIRRLFPGCTCDFRGVTLAPPLARVIAPLSWIGAHLLEALPFLRTHYLVRIRTPTKSP